jgi:hypothetical protein
MTFILSVGTWFQNHQLLGAYMMREAKEVDPRILNKIFSKSDRLDRIVNDILGIKKGRL